MISNDLHHVHENLALIYDWLILDLLNGLFSFFIYVNQLLTQFPASNYEKSFILFM